MFLQSSLEFMESIYEMKVTAGVWLLFYPPAIALESKLCKCLLLLLLFTKNTAEMRSLSTPFQLLKPNKF